MMTLDEILDLAVNTLKSNFPESIYSGFLVKDNKIFDPSTNSTTSNVTQQSVEIILDNLTQDEIQASGIVASDLKMYIIANDIQNINFYDFILYKDSKYRIFKVIESVVGSKSAVWTIIGRK